MARKRPLSCKELPSDSSLHGGPRVRVWACACTPGYFYFFRSSRYGKSQENNIGNKGHAREVVAMISERHGITPQEACRVALTYLKHRR